MLPAYLGTLAALILAALLPGGRVWGLDAFRFAPSASLAALAVVAAWPLAARLVRSHRFELRDSTFFTIAVLGSAALFVAGFARGHFLGDGYQSISLLAAERPFAKNTAPFTLFLLARLKEAIGGDPDRAALLAYRALSVTSGLLFLVAAWVLGARLLPRSRERRLFFLGLASGGWSLQFFGYVENYALFVTAVTAYALVGAWSARHGRQRHVAVGLAVLAASLHVLGLVLLPSLWVLLRGTRFERRIATWPCAARVALALVGVAAAAGVASAWLARNLGLRLIFVPPSPSRFIPDRYAWLAPSHGLDLANLALLLVPGLVVLLVGVWRVRADFGRDPALRFLGVLAACTLAGVFVLDPKLGMARDWDVFAFAGVPWAAAAYLALLTRARDDVAFARGAALAIALGVIVLVPRVLTNADEDRAYRRFRAHLELDPGRGRSSRYHVVQYLRRIGAEELAALEAQRWDRDYPERPIGREAMDARDRGELDLAVRLNEQAIRIAPSYSDPWNNLGGCFMARGEWQRARAAFDTALALSPGQPGIWLNLGTLAFRQNDFDAAEQWWLRAWRRDPEGVLPNHFLARLAQRRGDAEAYERHLAVAAASRGAAPRIVREWADLLDAKGLRQEADAARRRAEAQDAIDAETLGLSKDLAPDPDAPGTSGPR